jgi:hypothetical protein
LDKLSVTLASPLHIASVHQFSGSLYSLRRDPSQKILTLSGSTNGILVLNILDQSVDLEGYGIRQPPTPPAPKPLPPVTPPCPGPGQEQQQQPTKPGEGQCQQQQ